MPTGARWLRQVDADWINPHYLTSHDTLVLLAHKLWRLRGRVLASAWGRHGLCLRHAWLTLRLQEHARMLLERQRVRVAQGLMLPCCMAARWRAVNSSYVWMPRNSRIVLRTAASTSTARLRPAVTCSRILRMGSPSTSW